VSTPSPHLHVHREGEIARLVIDNPRKKNALDPMLLSALVDAIASLPAKGVLAAVLTAEGPIFSSGFDLDALQNEPRSAQALDVAVHAIFEGALPIVAALPGLAVGGGCELACACDLRVAHPGVALQMPPVRLGLVYPAAGLRRFVAMIGSARTRELFLTGERIEADRALAWGLIDRVVPAESVLHTATELARLIARAAPSAVHATRRTLAALQPPLPKDVEIVLADMASEASNAPDSVEARAAFLEKRDPRFSR
jgi:enoyl-CoA hydratase/carnithine racemase